MDAELMVKLLFDTRQKVIGITVLSVSLFAIAYFCWVNSNAAARGNVVSILRSESTPQQKLDELEPYVRLGQHISAVDDRLAVNPDGYQHSGRPTEHAFGFGGTSLVLHIRADGSVARIGRHVSGIDDGPLWLSPAVEW